MAEETVPKTLLVAGALSVVCSAFVATSAVRLRPLQEANEALFKKKNILIAAGKLGEDGKPKEGESIDDLFAEFDAKVVDLATGKYKDDIKAAEFDQKKAAKSTELGMLIDPKDDQAGIKRRSLYATVYLSKDEKGNLSQVILPVNGKGLWSTMYGFLALDKDMTTIKGFVFYEHGETPGLGGEVDNPKWKAQWIGKKVFDKEGNIKIKVIKGKVDPNSSDSPYQVDGLAGATITSRGVTATLDYWLGGNGFGPYLEKLKAGAKTGGQE